MKTHNTLFRAICVGTVLATTIWPATLGAQRVSGAGVVAVAPRLVDLGPGWTEREFGFAVDPLDQPPESVNEAASRDHTNWRAVLAQVRAGMEREGAVGMGHFSYGFGNRVHGDGRYDLYLTRFPDQRSLEQQWNRWSNHAAPSDRSSGPEVGDEAVWLPRTAADHDHRLVVRKGRYLARLECTATQDRARLLELARVIVERVARMTEPDGPVNGSQPLQPETNQTPARR